MSINIHVEAVLKGKFVPNNGTPEFDYNLTDSFHLYQTPTVITYQITSSDNPLKVYEEWVILHSHDEVKNIFDKDDFFEEGDPIGSEIINTGLIHITELKQWISEHTSYSIEWYEM